MKRWRICVFIAPHSAAQNNHGTRRTATTTRPRVRRNFIPAALHTNAVRLAMLPHTIFDCKNSAHGREVVAALQTNAHIALGGFAGFNLPTPKLVFLFPAASLFRFRFRRFLGRGFFHLARRVANHSPIPSPVARPFCRKRKSRWQASGADKGCQSPQFPNAVKWRQAIPLSPFFHRRGQSNRRRSVRTENAPQRRMHFPPPLYAGRGDFSFCVRHRRAPRRDFLRQVVNSRSSLI